MKHHFEMLNMFIKGKVINKDITKEHNNKMSHTRLKYTAHNNLKCRGSVTKPKWNYPKLIVALVSAKHDFMSVL